MGGAAPCSTSDLVGERREAQGHAFAGVALGLAVERLMLAVLLEQDHRQQAGTGPAAGHDVEWCWRLAIFSQSRHENFSRTVWITFH
jgi:hypothetical protein